MTFPVGATRHRENTVGHHRESHITADVVETARSTLVIGAT
ncbi:hypothetical protein [Nocardia sp. alder85J]|nr:hypothetical protein [Nocardia sp. alder85J]MCX4091954.1 hypothetical protein [Nocardia sp. alder85J]